VGEVVVVVMADEPGQRLLILADVRAEFVQVFGVRFTVRAGRIGTVVGGGGGAVGVYYELNIVG